MKNLQALVEIAGEHGLMALTTIPKLVAGRILHGMSIENLVAFDLPGRPFATWPDYAATGQIAPLFRFVNNQHGGGAFFRDKVLSAERCVENGIPILPVAAVVGRRLPDSGMFRALPDLAATVRFIDSAAMPQDAFIKPAGGMGGEGAFGARREGGNWVVGAELLTPAALAEKIAGNGNEKGVLIQPRIAMPAQMSPVGGQFGLATLRVQTALTRAGPQVLYIVQKILGGKLAVDNFTGGAKGNLIAAVDAETGALGIAYGRRAGQRHVLGRYTAHPLTGEPITGFRLPAIEEVVAVAKRIAASFPDSPLVGSDIAITEDGVKVVEINNSPDQLLAQIACGRGVASIFRDIIPDLPLPAAQVEKAKTIMASCINKRRKTVNYD